MLAYVVGAVVVALALVAWLSPSVLGLAPPTSDAVRAGASALGPAVPEVTKTMTQAPSDATRIIQLANQNLGLADVLAQMNLSTTDIETVTSSDVLNGKIFEFHVQHAYGPKLIAYAPFEIPPAAQAESSNVAIAYRNALAKVADVTSVVGQGTVMHAGHAFDRYDIRTSDAGLVVLYVTGQGPLRMAWLMTGPWLEQS